MGMFDYIRCELPLPDGWEAPELQSKDFDCEMVTHVISKDGKMMLDRGHNEEAPLLERSMWKAEWGTSEKAQEDHALEALCGCIRRVPKYVDANFHGHVNFYGHDREKNWHEYNAKFTDGKLVEIATVPDGDNQ